MRQLHFHLPDHTSFFRFHRPSLYGDSLKGIRYSVDKIIDEQKPIYGFEEGRIFSGFRFLYPLFDSQKQYIGSVEISFSYNAFKKLIKENIPNTLIDFMIQEKVVTSKVLKSELQQNYHKSQLCDCYLHETHEKTFNNAIMHNIEQKLKPLIRKKVKKYRTFSIENRGYIVSFLPISNIKGELGTAYFILFRQSEIIKNIDEQSILLKTFITFLNLIISILLYFLLHQNVRQKKAAETDSLTGIYNRRGVKERLEHLTSNSFPLTIAYFDIDKFKEINDTFGHDVGDEVILRITKIVQNNLEKEDIFARWGGDEFIILFPKKKTPFSRQIIENIRQEIHNTDFKIDYNVSCSFGVTEYKANESIDDFIQRSDYALYDAKKSGRDAIIIL